MSRPSFLFLSDLHLGAGDALEDFLFWGDLAAGPAGAEARREAVGRLDAALGRFLAAQAADPVGEPHLVLLGDTFDLWQVQRRRESAARALERILSAHAGAVAGLRAWRGAGGAITLVVGNHDQPLVDPAAWGLLTEVIPGLNASVGGRPVHFLSLGGVGLYAEHGHQWDPLNRLRRLDLPQADCVGRRFVRTVVNTLEPVFPLLDKGKDFGDFLRQLWQAGSGEGVPLWQEVAGHLVRLAGRSAGPAGVLAEELGRWLTSPRLTPNFARVAASQRAQCSARLRRVLAGRPGAATGSLPAGFRFLLSGHTHEAFHHRHGAVEHLNPGTWRPTICFEGDTRWSVRQRLTAATLRWSDGDWRAGLTEAGPE